MTDLKLHNYEPETDPPAPIPFNAPDQTWRSTEQDDELSTEESRMDSIAHTEKALADLDAKLDDLSDQVDEYFEPISMKSWMETEDDDGPWAA